MVHAEALEADTLTRAIDNGDFYASSGVTLKEINYDEEEKTLSIHVNPDDDAKFTIQFVGTKRTKDGKLPPEDAMGTVLAETTGVSASYTATDEDLYVRAVITSSKPHPNPSFKGQTEKAWTQPVGWKLKE